MDNQIIQGLNDSGFNVEEDRFKGGINLQSSEMESKAQVLLDGSSVAPLIDETFAKMASDHGMTMRQLEKEGLAEEMSIPVDSDRESRDLQMFDLRQEDIISLLDTQPLSPQELQEIYDRSLQDGKKEQTVRGELYVGKNPSLLNFISKQRQRLIPKLRRFLSKQENMRESANINVEQSVTTSLKPASIFDDESLDSPILGEEESKNRGSK